jgi:YbbR domain-containing protein
MRDWLTNDFGWKIFSVLLAVTLWLTAHRILQESVPPVAAPFLSPMPVGKTFTNLPVLIVSADADVREFRVTPNVVSVSVSAQPEIMAGLQADEIRALVDLTDIEGAHDLRRRVDVSTPAGVTFVFVSPTEVNVVLPPRRK